MAIAESVTNAQNILKVLYPDGVSTPTYKKSPIVGMMNKDTEFTGVGTKYVIVNIAPGSGGAASIQTAIANQGPFKPVRFSLGRKKLYHVESIEGEALAAGSGSKGAVVDLLQTTMDGALNEWAIMESAAVWGNGGGSRGVIAAGSNLASPTVTLATRGDGVKWYSGMYVQVATDDGSSSTPAGTLGSGMQVQLASVTKLSGTGTATLTLASGNWNQIPGIATGNFLFRSGDYAAYPNGVPGWAPLSDPISTDNFLGVNRFTAGDLNALSGYRVIGGGQPKSQTLIDAAAEAQQNGLDDVSTVFMNPLDQRDAFKEQSTFKSIAIESTDANVGYEGIQVLSAIGSLKVVAENNVPKGSFWMLNPKTWTRRSLGEVPFLVDQDGIKKFLRSPTDDVFQFRLAGYFNYENKATASAIAGTF